MKPEYLTLAVGYGRMYIPTPLPGSRNNLVLGEGTEAGYNYEVDIENHSKG
jgi:hypothetical protein